MKRLRFKSSQNQHRLNVLERELIAAYDRVLHTDYPNPERTGCPGTETLRKLVLSPERPNYKSTLEHLGRCAPCVDELKMLRLKMKAKGKHSSH